MRLRNSRSKFALNAVLIIAALILVATSGPAHANELKEMEAAAQRTALRVLDALKPLAAWLDSTVVTSPSIEPIGQPAAKAEEKAKPRRIKLAFKPGYEDQAMAILRTSQYAVTLLERLADGAEDTIKRRYGDKQADPNDAKGQADFLSLARIRKYRRVVVEKFNGYTGLAGGVPAVAQRPVGRNASIKGTVRVGLGSNTATAEVVDGKKTETDVARSDMALDITADLSPRDQLLLSAGRREEIRYAPMSQTQGRVSYTRRLQNQAFLGGRIGMDQYANEADDRTNVNRTEYGVRGGIAPSARFRANGDYAVTGASYVNNDALDYQESRLTLGGGGELSRRTAWGFDYGHASYHPEEKTIAEDNVRDNISGNITFNKERSSLAVIVRSDGVTFDDDKSATYRRTGIELRGRTRSGVGRSSTWSLSARSKKHDALEDRNYSEYRGDLQKRSGWGTNQERSSHLFLNYRNFDGEKNPLYLDYLEGRLDSRSARTNILWEFNNYVQHYFRNGSAQRNGRLSQFAWCGLILAPNQGIIIGPYAATNTDLIADEDSDLGLFESASNTVRYGIKGSARINNQSVSIDGQIRYEKLRYYNMKKSPSPGRLEIEVRGLVTVSSRLDASVQSRYYLTGADDPGAVRSSEFDILGGLVYHLGRTQ